MHWLEPLELELLLEEELLDDELLLDEDELDDATPELDELLEELDELLEDELLEELVDDVDEPLPPPVTENVPMDATLDPVAQKPKDTDAPGAMFALYASGVTILPLRWPPHRLFMLDPFKARPTVQLVILAVPLLAITTFAQ